MTTFWLEIDVCHRVATDHQRHVGTMLTQLRMLEPVGIHSHNAKLGDSSLAHEDKVFAKLVSDEAMLRSYDTSNFKGQDKISYDILAYFLGNQVRGEPWRTTTTR